MCMFIIKEIQNISCISYSHRLKKQFPNKTRADLVAHEDWVIRARNFHRQKRSLVNDW